MVTVVSRRPSQVVRVGRKNQTAPAYKRCTKCNVVKARVRFGYQHQSVTALQSHCKQCQNQGRMERRNESAMAVARYKMERGCADCGYREHPSALQLDHIPGTEKKFSVAAGMHRSAQVIWDEVAKCEVVCGNCHIIRTETRRIDVPHKSRPKKAVVNFPEFGRSNGVLVRGRTCLRCEMYKVVAEFGTARGNLLSWCKACHQEYRRFTQLAQYQKIAAYKLLHGCTDCGFNKHHAALHFDHLPGTTKLFQLSNGHTRSDEAVWAEVAKCELVCCNCHAVRTQDRRTVSHVRQLATN